MVVNTAPALPQKKDENETNQYNLSTKNKYREKNKMDQTISYALTTCGVLA